MVEQIATLHAKYKGKSGAVEHIAGLISQRWECCAGFRVLGLEAGGSCYTSVYHLSRGETQPTTS